MTKSKGIRIMGWIGYRLLGNIKVTPSGCFEWQKHITEWGYGRMWANRRMKYAHRVSYELFRGAIPEGLKVLHRCDNPACINPAHLFLGTDADNIRDRDQKGRGATGERAGRAKLKACDIRAIVSRYVAGERAADLADSYEVHYETILAVLKGESYREVERPALRLKSGRRKCLSTSG